MKLACLPNDVGARELEFRVACATLPVKEARLLLREGCLVFVLMFEKAAHYSRSPRRASIRRNERTADSRSGLVWTDEDLVPVIGTFWNYEKAY